MLDPGRSQNKQGTIVQANGRRKSSKTCTLFLDLLYDINLIKLEKKAVSLFSHFFKYTIPPTSLSHCLILPNLFLNQVKMTVL